MTPMISGIRAALTPMASGIRAAMTPMASGMRAAMTPMASGIRAAMTPIISGIRAAMSRMIGGILRPVIPAASLLAPLLLVAAPAGAQPVNEAIGPWRLACAQDRMTDRTSCALIHAQPAERSTPGSPSLALEIIDRGGRLVPAVTARDLGLDNAARGLLAIAGTAQLRFPPNPLFEMPCGLEGRSLVCAPREADRARAEQELATADRVLVRVVATGGLGGAAEPTELPLSRTRDAMARFRALVPPGAAAPDGPAIEPRDLLNRFRQMFN